MIASIPFATPGWIALLAGIAAYLLWVGFHQRSQRKIEQSAFETRLKEFQTQSSMASQDMTTIEAAQREPFLRQLGKQLESVFFSGRNGKPFMQAIDDRLTLAGNPHGWAGTDFIAFCATLIGSIALFGGLLVRSNAFPAVLYIAAVLLACLYPYFFLKGSTTSRREQAFAELPYLLDQIILSLSGGDTLDASLKNLVMANDSVGLKDSQRVLVREFRQAYLETANHVKTFNEAYRDAAERIGVQEVSDLVEVFIDADTTGAPILHILEDMSKQVYTVFEQNMATLIKKKDSTFTVATVIIMVSTAIIIATPIVLTVAKALSGGSQ